MDAHLQGAAALHAPLSYKQHMDLISLVLGCRRVIMFLCASRLPSFAPGHWPSRASRSQVTAGWLDPINPWMVLAVLGNVEIHHNMDEIDEILAVNGDVDLLQDIEEID